MKFIQPLKNKVVLDFSRLVPGPFCSKILADLGATVIKVEDRDKGDYLRDFPPFYFENESSFAVFLNKNKKRLCLDFFTREGRLLILRLIKNVDVVLESFRPTVMSKLGLGYSQLKKYNPRLLYVSLTGFGVRGEMSGRAGHDLNFLAASGFLDCLHETRPNNSLHRYLFADFIGGGVMTVMSILSHFASGKKFGQHLQLSLTDHMAYLSEVFFTPGVWEGLEMFTGKLARYRVYETQDGGAVALAALEDKFWQRFCKAVGRGDLAAIGLDKKQNAVAVPALKKIFMRHSQAYWHKFSLRHDVCLSVVNICNAPAQNSFMEKATLAFAGQKRQFYQSHLNVRRQHFYRRAGADNREILKKF